MGYAFSSSMGLVVTIGALGTWTFAAGEGGEGVGRSAMGEASEEAGQTGKAMMAKDESAGSAFPPKTIKADLEKAAKAASARVADRDIEGARRIYEDALRAALEVLSDEPDAGYVIRATLERAAKAEGARAALDALRAGYIEAMVAIDFRPLVESPLPEGFPSFTPVGRVEVKEYPTVRAAQTSAMTSGGGGRNALFWRLFQHIQRNGIPMTAPVVMESQAEEDGRRLESMAFLYRSDATGKPGEDVRDGKVEVRDWTPLRAVSLGVRGEYTEESLARGIARLEAWLLSNSERWGKSGEPRVLAYNSPFVPAMQKYWEVQIPVEPTASRGEDGIRQTVAAPTVDSQSARTTP